MPQKCSVYGCRSNYYLKNKYVSTFSLPRDTQLREKWLQIIPRDLSSLKNPQVCSKHFENECILWSTEFPIEGGEPVIVPRKKPTLAVGAIPTIFPDERQYVVNTRTSRTAIISESKVYTATSTERSKESKNNLIEQLSSQTVPIDVKFEAVVKQEIDDDSFVVDDFQYTQLQIKTEPEEENESRSFQCVVCEETFDREISLHRHILVHLSEDKKLFQDKSHTCKKEFSKKEYLELHLQTHLSDSVKQFRCNVCYKKYTLKANLRIHILNTHLLGVDKPYKCSVCNESFLFKSRIKRHMYVHLSKVDRQYRCNVCDEMFSDRTSISRHLDVHLPDGVKRFECNVCYEKYSHKTNLKHHMKTHLLEVNKPYKCNVCNKSFLSKSSIKRHMNVHLSKVGRQYRCNACDMTFLYKTYKNQHVNSHIIRPKRINRKSMQRR